MHEDDNNTSLGYFLHEFVFFQVGTHHSYRHTTITYTLSIHILHL